MTTTQNPDTTTRFPEAAIVADEHVPAVHIWRDFEATPDRFDIPDLTPVTRSAGALSARYRSRSPG